MANMNIFKENIKNQTKLDQTHFFIIFCLRKKFPCTNKWNTSGEKEKSREERDIYKGKDEIRVSPEVWRP